MGFRNFSHHAIVITAFNVPVNGELPVGFASDGDISYFADVMFRVGTTKNDFATVFRVVDISACSLKF